MPRFTKSGGDYCMCQVCGTDCNTDQVEMVWRPIPSRADGSSGNVCPTCLPGLDKPEPWPASTHDGLGRFGLYEHCRRESGLTDPRQVAAYMQRHYGHG